MTDKLRKLIKEREEKEKLYYDLKRQIEWLHIDISILERKENNFLKSVFLNNMITIIKYFNDYNFTIIELHGFSDDKDAKCVIANVKDGGMVIFEIKNGLMTYDARYCHSKDSKRKIKKVIKYISNLCEEERRKQNGSIN